MKYRTIENKTEIKIFFELGSNKSIDKIDSYVEFPDGFKFYGNALRNLKFLNEKCELIH